MNRNYIFDLPLVDCRRLVCAQWRSAHLVLRPTLKRRETLVHDIAGDEVVGERREV